MSKEMDLTQHSAYKKSPKWTISSRIPPREIGKGMPGPGAYGMTNCEKDKFHSASKISIAGANRDGKEWGALPGPGAYAPQVAPLNIPKWSFGSDNRLQEIKRSRTPGPGAYDTRGNLEGLKFSVVSKPGGTIAKSSTPGPGQYKPSYDQIFDSPMRASFGSSTRSEMASSKQPGPGQYDQPSVLGGNCYSRAMPRYSIAGKRPEVKTDTTPGPGSAGTQFSR